MHTRTRTLTALAGTSIAALALAGCAATAPQAEVTGLSIVASTNVYGDIAATLGGDFVTVTSIIESAAQDPHSYEASAQDQLAIANADIVIENGGGYDPFIDVLVEGSGTEAIVISAVEASGMLEGDVHAEGEHAEGEHAEEEHADETTADDHVHEGDDHDHAHEGDEHADEAHSDEAHSDEAHSEGDDHEGHSHIEGFNEHVWYEIHAIEGLAEAVTAALSEADADNASTYQANLAAFLDELEALEAEIETVAASIGSGAVAVTEPVPTYLLAELGLTDETPADFVEAIEEGADVSPLALQQTLDLVSSGELRLLAYTEQTTSPETERVLAAAEAAGVPVVSFTETLPEGEDYVSWMRANVTAVAAALGA